MKKRLPAISILLAVLSGFVLVLWFLGVSWQPALADPDVLHAAPSAAGSADCSDWDNACTLQAALALAAYGDQIWVKEGVHKPGMSTRDTFTLVKGVEVYGGFAGTEDQLSQRDWIAHPTVLSGDIDHNDTTDPNGVVTDTANIVGDNSHHVVSSDGLTDTARLEGFVITAGYSSSGSGMLNSQSDPTLVDLTIIGNLANSGGGMYNDESSPSLANVTLSRNSASNGGGMFNSSSSNPTLVNVIFSDNSASGGGGMYNQQSSPTLVNVVFFNNTASAGGGLVNDRCNPVLINVTFNANTATIGGGIHNDSSNPTLKNVIMWGDAASTSPEINNSNSSPTISYSDIQGSGGSGAGWNSTLGTDGGGNIEADPKFRNANGADLRLNFDSPAIDAGDNSALPGSVTTDLDGNPRFVDIPTMPDTGSGTLPIVDMGAYETQRFADVTLKKSVYPTTVEPGQPLTYTLEVTSSGTISAAQVVLTDTLPAFLTDRVISWSGLTMTDTGHSPAYVWEVHDLDPGEGGLITVSGILAEPLTGGVYTNTAVVAFDSAADRRSRTGQVSYTVSSLPPAFTSTPGISATRRLTYTYSITSEDRNGGTLTISAPTLPGWLTLTDHGGGTATLSGVPDSPDLGEHPIELRVTDSDGLTTEQNFTILVVDNIFLPIVVYIAP